MSPAKLLTHIHAKSVNLLWELWCNWLSSLFYSPQVTMQQSSDLSWLQTSQWHLIWHWRSGTVSSLCSTHGCRQMVSSRQHQLSPQQKSRYPVFHSGAPAWLPAGVSGLRRAAASHTIPSVPLKFFSTFCSSWLKSEPSTYDSFLWLKFLSVFFCHFL